MREVHRLIEGRAPVISGVTVRGVRHGWDLVFLIASALGETMAQ